MKLLFVLALSLVCGLHAIANPQLPVRNATPAQPVSISQAEPPSSVSAKVDSMPDEISFIAGISVLTEDGNSPIEKLSAGNRVWTTDPLKRKSGSRKVTVVSAKEANSLVDVLTTSREKIEATPSALFWVNLKGWVAAKALFPGEQLLQRDGSFTAVFNVIPKRVSPTKVYSIDVEGTHSYYVGKKGVLVRSTNPGLVARKS